MSKPFGVIQSLGLVDDLKFAFIDAGNHALAILPTLVSAEGLAYGTGFAGLAYLKAMVNPTVAGVLPNGKAGSGLWAIYQGAWEVAKFKYGMGLSDV